MKTRRDVNLSKDYTKEDVIQNKKQAIRILNKLLESLINDSSEQHLKKANLISYWLKNFANYIEFEESFSPSRLIRYSRGNVIRANLGFNIGKEMGGLHYAIVLDNDNKRNADVITIIPLSSTDGRMVHERNVDLGTELFERVSIRQKNLLHAAQKELEDYLPIHNLFDSLTDAILKSDSQDISEDLALIDRQRVMLENKEKIVKRTISILESHSNEILKMKHGSMAVVNQIRTISKQRIYIPKKSEDFLYNISLSAAAMDKINSKIKELFIFEK